MQLPLRADMISYLLYGERLALEALEPDGTPSSRLASMREEFEKLDSWEIQRRYRKMLREHWDYVADPAEFQHWCRMSGWTGDEAAALLLGKDPKFVTPDVLNQPFSTPYQELRALIRRAQEMGVLAEPMRPQDVLSWAERLGIPIPRKLRSGFSAAASDPELRRLAAENADLRTQLARVGEAESIASLDPKKRLTLYKLIIGMAIDKYKFDPDAAGPTTTASHILAGVAPIPLNVDTISDMLRDGVKLLREKGIKISKKSHF